MPKRLVVINPNSTQSVTDGISAALNGFRFPDGPAIDCLTLAEGPPGIETQRHVDQAVDPICALVSREAAAADGFVIACFSDPGLQSARAITSKPVMGISESGMLTACVKGERFGIIAILPTSIPRHLRMVRQLGLTDRFAGDRALGLGVAALKDRATVYDRMAAVAADLRDRDGADVLILGCAGMAYLRADLERDAGLPVIDPTQAAVAMALGQIAVS
ncbi:MAG: aspartate/glutamate racemase family protein [Alphaproteobacteria bacterium]|nr:aspartate/glutamate racemase family protein [Alphaproteobacteria bacterium]